MAEGEETAVLVIENNDSLSKALVNVLQSNRFKPLAASDFDSALNTLKAEHPAVVLTELKIGEKTAFDFLKAVKSSSDHPGTAVIFISSNKNPKIITAAAKAGAADFLVKPFSPEVLVEKLQKALTRSTPKTPSSAVEKLIAAGKQCIEEKRLQDATTLFAKAAKTDAEAADAFMGLAEVCRIKKDMDQYEKLALKASELHARHDDFEKAQDIFLELRRYDANAPNPFKVVAQDLAEKADMEGAVRSYQKAALADPEDAEVYFGLSEAHMKLGHMEQAEKSLVASLKLDEDNPAARKLYRGMTGGK